MADYKSSYTGEQIDSAIEKANTSIHVYRLNDYVTIDWENMQPYENEEYHYFVPVTVTAENFEIIINLIENNQTFYLEDISSRDYDWEKFKIFFNFSYSNGVEKDAGRTRWIRLGALTPNISQGVEAFYLYDLELQDNSLKGQLHLAVSSLNIPQQQ